MSQDQNKEVRIAPQTEGKESLSPAQKQFNNLTKKIERQKKRLLEWNETMSTCQQKASNELLPLQESGNALRVEWVMQLDRCYDNPLFKKTDKSKIRHLICEASEIMISDFGNEDLKPIFNKYSDDDYDSLSQESDDDMQAYIKSMAEEMFNIDLGDDIDLSSPEAFQAHLQEKLRTQFENEAETSGKKTRKKTKKQLQDEARRQEEAALASKSVQEVYRKLVATLHPDREPDAEERERKTELMQRVNIAYEKKDLLQLLTLQLEIEQIDQAHLNHIADSRLKYFNKILKEQSTELEQEIIDIETTFRLQLNLPYYSAVNPQSVLSELSRDIKQLKADITMLKKEIESFKNPASLKAWLKNYRIPKNNDYDIFDDFF